MNIILTEYSNSPSAIKVREILQQQSSFENNKHQISSRELGVNLDKLEFPYKNLDS